MILAGDIGGTKTNLAIFDGGKEPLAVDFEKSYPSQEYRSLNEVIAAFRKEHAVTITGAAFGIAGPILEGRSKLTNLGWDVSAAGIAADLRLKTVGLLNDLEATAYGILRLRKEDLVVLQAGKAEPRGAIAVIAAGTGLGEGALVWDGRRYRAMPSEGGHSDFAPRNELEMDLLRFLLGRHARVSYERVIAGPGLVSLYEFFRSRAKNPEPAWLRDRMAAGDPSAVVSSAGLEGTEESCAGALRLFVSLYGAEAGNVALKFLATGGVYIGGGIAPKILAEIRKDEFIASFNHKGRYEPLLRRMPVLVVLNDKTALLGAAHYALTMHEQD